MRMNFRFLGAGALFAGAILASPSVFAASKDMADPKIDFDKVQIETLQIRPNIYLLSGAGSNMTVQTGPNGVLVVDTLYGGLSDKLLAAIRKISDKPIRYIVDTSYREDHVGGNAAIRKAGATVTGGNVAFDISDAAQGAAIISFETVLNRLSAPTGKKATMPEEAWPTDTYFTAGKDLYFNGEAVRIYHMPAAATDGDSIVFFRKSDVISVGDVFQMTTYPVIDLDAGGSLQGLIDAETRIIGMMVADYGVDGGTLLIPGHGRATEMGDIIWYREMLSIIRDRIKDMIAKGKSLKVVLAAKPSRDFDGRYAAASGPATAENFVTMAYKSLVAEKNAKKNAAKE
jgi:cyclase